MKTGVIVYVADAEAVSKDFDAEAAALAQGLAPEWTEVAASAPGFYGVPEALLSLVTRGAGRVDLVSAQPDGAQGLALASLRVRLRG